MKKHQICLKDVPDDLYQDLKRVKELDGRSMSSIIREGSRLLINQINFYLFFFFYYYYSVSKRIRIFFIVKNE